MDEKEIKDAIKASVEEELKKVDRKVTPTPDSKPDADPKGGFKSFGHFFRDVINAESPGERCETLRNWTTKTAGYMEEGDLSQGGYLVPEEFRATLMQTALEA